MVSFGELSVAGKYDPTAGENGLENAQSRAGYEVLPGVDAGRIAPPIDFDTLLESEFWAKTRFYQPSDFLWQPTLFQPIGGMDRVQHAFAQQVAALGGTIYLNSPVKSIDWDTEVGVVPIFGGISWTDDDITQVWYPSCDFHGKLGVLTGTYKFSKIAWEWGNMPIRDRLPHLTALPDTRLMVEGV